MKCITKKFMVMAIMATSVFLLAACRMGNDEKIPSEGPTHFMGTLTFGSGHRVWEVNPHAMKVSDVYRPFTGDREIIALVRVYDENNVSTGEEVEVGRGKIEGGILRLSVNEPGQEHLVGWAAMRNSNFYYWEDSTVSVPEVMGNEVIFRTSNNQRLIRETMSGTRDFLSQYVVRFIFVDRDVKISGTKSLIDGIIPGTGETTPTYFYTENILELRMERGWNTLHRRQTFYTDDRGDGRSGITMELRNPLDYKWVLYPEGFDGTGNTE